MHSSFHFSHPPDFLKLLAHELRWQLLKALASSDFRVQELVQYLEQPQNLISYHLKQLRKQGIVQEHRSLADGREIYYSLDLDQVKRLYQTSGEALHPALQLADAGIAPRAKTVMRPIRVLFLCTHNSARSQMAEGILQKRGQDTVEAFSAGTEVTTVHPLAIQALGEINIDISKHRSKHLKEFLEGPFDYIITVCDLAREACPVFPGALNSIHWSLTDPASVEGSEEEKLKAFRETASNLYKRIGYFLLVSAESMKS
jgi:thioredoxin type arsenate reductase